MTQPFWHNKLGRLLQHGTHGQDAGKTHALIPCGCLGPSPARVFQNRGNSWRSMKLSIIKHVDMHANYWGPQEWMVYSKEPAICGSIDISLLTLCCPVCGSCNAIDWTNHQWSSVESVHNLRGIIRSIFLISETSFYLYIYICNGCINEKKTQFDVIYGLLSSIPCFGNPKPMDTSITSDHGVLWGCSPIQLQVYLGFQSRSKTVVLTSDSMYHPQDMLGSPGVRHFISQTWMNIFRGKLVDYLALKAMASWFFSHQSKNITFGELVGSKLVNMSYMGTYICIYLFMYVFTMYFLFIYIMYINK